MHSIHCISEVALKSSRMVIDRVASLGISENTVPSTFSQGIVFAL